LCNRPCQCRRERTPQAISHQQSAIGQSACRRLGCQLRRLRHRLGRRARCFPFDSFPFLLDNFRFARRRILALDLSARGFAFAHFRQQRAKRRLTDDPIDHLDHASILLLPNALTQPRIISLAQRLPVGLLLIDKYQPQAKNFLPALFNLLHS